MTIVDARDRSIPSGPYRRVVSLVPSLTETVCRLGAADRLVGRTLYCVEPRLQVRGIPEYGGTKNPKIEQIVAQGPDLVLACVEENKAEHLEELELEGVPVFTVMPRTLDDVDRLLGDLGALLGVEDAAKTARADLKSAREDAARWRERLEAARKEIDAPFPVPAATLIWKNPWLVAGSGTYIHAVMEALGLDNRYGERSEYYEIELEDLESADLDLVLMPDEPYRWSKRDVVVVSEAAGYVESTEFCPRLDGKQLAWYGTRTAGALRDLTRRLDPLLIGE